MADGTHLIASAPHPVDTYVGARIRARRRAINMSQEKLAAALNLTFQQVQKYERGVNRVSASKLHAIAGALSCQVGDFFDGLGVAGDGEAVGAEHRAMIGLATLPFGLELAELMPRLSNRQRRALLTIAQDLAGEDPGVEGATGSEPAVSVYDPRQAAAFEQRVAAIAQAEISRAATRYGRQAVR